MIESFNEEELEEKIDRYVNGKLSPAEIDELWAELVQDPYHLDYLRSVANVKAVVEKEVKKRRQARIRRIWSYAAAAVITLFLGVMLVMNVTDFTGTSDVQPVQSIELDYYRSAEGAAENGATVITRAITLANTGQFQQAVTLLNSELQTENITPAWESEVSLTLGSLYYNEGQYPDAIPHYETVIGHRDDVDVLTLEKAYWYLGNTYFQMERLEDARENIQKAYALNGAYRRVAQSYLEALAR
ncbi:MAG: tetratricopeptide repeat protein [Balneolaceae bacterium]|nr:tetratricopeptide repeat protein [Balneolaceae bacterium]